MPIESLKILFNRNLNKSKIEIELNQNESDSWKIQKGIANSIGNLCLNLVEKLNTYIGAKFWKTGHIRNKALEFSF